MAYANPAGGGGGKRPKLTKNQLLAAGGIILAGMVVLLGILAIFGGHSSAKTDSASTTSPVPAGSSSPLPPAPPTSVPPLPDPSVILHQGTVTLTMGNRSDGVDLDSTAANWDEGPSSAYVDDLELAMDGSQLHYPPGSSNFVRVDPSAPVTYATCSAATGHVDVFYGPGDGSDQINTRLRFCVRTTQGRFAFVQVLSAPIDPNTFGGGLASVTVKVTTWARPA